MKILSLEIKKRESYDSEYPNEIVGVVQIIGETGKMVLHLGKAAYSNFQPTDAALKADELAATDSQPLKAEIAELAGGLELMCKDGRCCQVNVQFYIDRLRQLSTI